MATTTAHPLVLDLGDIRGLSAFEEWKATQGEDVTWDDFLEAIRNGHPTAEEIAAALHLEDKLDNEPVEGSENLVMSGGVGSAIQTAIGARGSDDGTDWKLVSVGSTLLYDVEPNTRVRFAATADASVLTLKFPDSAADGQTFRCFAAAKSSATNVTVTIDSENVPILITGARTTASKSIAVQATYVDHKWYVLVFSLATWYDPQNSTCRVVYPGANKAATTGKTYTETKAAGIGFALSKSYFRSLYGATFKNWNTKADGTGSTYTDGQNVTLQENQTLTLYPQYNAGSKSVAVGYTTDHSITTSGGGSSKTETFSVSFTPASYVSGYKESTIQIQIHGSISSGNDHVSRVSYRVGTSGSWTTLCSQSGCNTGSGTKTLTIPGNKATTIQFQVYQEPGSKQCKSTYRAYISKVLF